MTTSSAALPRWDFIRAPILATVRPEGYKEWHHFVVHRRGWRLLLNFSLTSETLPGRPPRLVPRVIVLAHDQRWTGVVERFDTEPAMSADLNTLALGGNRITVEPGGYEVLIDLPAHGIRGRLDLTPTTRPFVASHAVGEGRINWLFVPRLRADGWFSISDQEHHLEGDVAYHDHNWGRFRWGDDFGWEWGSILPSDPENPWSFVFVRLTDRRRLRSPYQALYVCRPDEPAALFRDAALRTSSSGLLRRAPDCTLPPAMRLVLSGDASDVPASVRMTARSSADVAHAEFRPESYTRVALPSEVRLDRSVVLCESSGAARVKGSVDGQELDVTGVGVFELLHG
jgi:hypothetical protein